MNTTTEIKVKTGYEFLREMTSFFADFNARTPRLNPITNRVEYILYQLNEMGVKSDLDTFNANNPDKLDMNALKYANVYAFFKGKNPSDETIVFLAHHDVSNIHSENCQDNTASLCNLLHLCGILKDEVLDKNVLIAFVDAEEIVSPDTCGAKRLAILSKMGMFGKVIKAINLELTAEGTELWATCRRSFRLLYDIQTTYKARKVSTPYNDAFVLEGNGMESVCIGTLTTREMANALYSGFCATWSLCHKESDTLDKANEGDMENFVENILLPMAKE